MAACLPIVNSYPGDPVPRLLKTMLEEIEKMKIENKKLREEVVELKGTIGTNPAIVS